MATAKHSRSELRKDYVQDKYVIIAPRRSGRPHHVQARQPEPKSAALEFCPFCLGNALKERYIMTLGPARNWRIMVKKNKYAAVTIDNPKAYGVQEVVIETPDHNKHLDDLSEQTIIELFDVYAQRTKELTANPRIEYVLIFKNDGGPAGASIKHSHSQIFATDFVPPHLLDKSKKVFEYRVRCGACPYCDIIGKETKGPRRVYADEHVVAFAPYASQHNYELWILPRRHIDNVTDLNRSEKLSWARVLKRALLAVSKLGLPYNYYFHQVVHDTDQHLYMKITPRGSVWAGVEIGSGIVINPVSPEDAAKYYRKAMNGHSARTR